MTLLSTRFVKRCWCGLPASVCKKAAEEAQDKRICPKCGARPMIGDYIHCPHNPRAMPKAFHDNMQAQIDRENQKDFLKVLAHEAKVRRQLEGQRLDRIKFKGVMYETMPGIGFELDGSTSGYVYNILISAYAGYAIAKREGITAADFEKVRQTANVMGIIDTDKAEKIKEIENWLSKRLDHSGATMQAALTLLFFLLKDGPEKTFKSVGERYLEFDLETAIARLHFENKAARQEIIDTVLLLKNDKELCTIAD